MKYQIPCMEVWQSWSIALVLKTSEPKGSVGSNPTASAKCIYNCHCPSGLGVGPQNLQHWFESNMAVIYI